VGLISCKSRPPNVPSVEGPTSGFIASEYHFYVMSKDPNHNDISYQFDWGDSTQTPWSNFVPSESSFGMSHTWLSVGNYSLKARAKDIKGLTSDWSITTFKCKSHTPHVPSVSGPFYGFISSEYSFSALSDDPDGDSISYQFDWGDGNLSYWSDFVPNNTPVTMSHLWFSEGSCHVKARSLDTKGTISNWSEPSDIEMFLPGKLKWIYREAGAELTNPAIGSDGTIYIGGFGESPQYFYALNPDGTLKWKYGFENNEYTSCGHPIIGSDGTIYLVAGYYDLDSYIYALNSDGTLKWKYKTSGSIPQPALCSDGTIIFRSNNDHCVYALNSDGTLKWKYFVGNGCSPSIGEDGTIYLLVDKFLYAMQDTVVKWTFETDNNVALGPWEPVIGPDGTIYFSEYFDSLFAINPNGTLKWSLQKSLSAGPIIGEDGTIYFGTQEFDWNGAVYAVQADGTIKWKYYLKDIWAHFLAVADDGLIYFGTPEWPYPNFYALNPDGTLNWKQRLMYYGPAGTHPFTAVAGDGTIYVVYQSQLYALQGAAPLAHSSWPQFRHDVRNTGNIGTVKK
jgi:outer membrane protein assembly factor BamB